MSENSHPSYQKNIPDPSSTNIGNLESSGHFKLDTCNEKSKKHRLIFEQVYDAVEDYHNDNSDEIFVFEVDCWNHFRNLWFRGTTKAISTLLGNTPRKELDGINLWLDF